MISLKRIYVLDERLTCRLRCSVPVDAFAQYPSLQYCSQLFRLSLQVIIEQDLVKLLDDIFERLDVASHINTHGALKLLDQARDSRRLQVRKVANGEHDSVVLKTEVRQTIEYSDLLTTLSIS